MGGAQKREPGELLDGFPSFLKTVKVFSHLLHLVTKNSTNN